VGRWGRLTGGASTATMWELLSLTWEPPVVALVLRSRLMLTQLRENAAPRLGGAESGDDRALDTHSQRLASSAVCDGGRCAVSTTDSSERRACEVRVLMRSCNSSSLPSVNSVATIEA
jgi:hypothetical protein